VTIPRRADVASGDLRAAPRTNLLAELPHVGEEQAVAHADSPARTRKSSHPAFAEYPDYDDEAAVEPVRTRTTRFVDRAHIDDEWDREAPERRQSDRYSDQPLIHRERQSSRKPRAKAGVGGLLSDVHQQMAPFAGLIVTAALVAAAGLLFHMMAGGNRPNAELDEFALPGFQVEAIEETLPADDSIPLAEADLNPEPTKPETLDASPSVATPSDSSEQKTPATDVAAQDAPPIASSEIEPTAPLGQLSFPQTSTPLALDYSKATDPDLQKLPEVAERTEPAANDGINR
jgi:hypothetical protein